MRLRATLGSVVVSLIAANWIAVLGFIAPVHAASTPANNADLAQGVHVIDFRTPTSPIAVGLVDTMGCPVSVTIEGGRAYVVASLSATTRVSDMENCRGCASVDQAPGGLEIALDCDVVAPDDVSDPHQHHLQESTQ